MKREIPNAHHIFFIFIIMLCVVDCPNNCSNHGQCLSIRDIATHYGQIDVSNYFEYGSADAIETSAWDHDVVHGCVCDSSWKVGYQAGETQLPEYFGADCSLSKLLR
jgi:hypothetical protein